MKRLILSAAAAAILASGPSIAADIPRKAPSPGIAAFSWTGCYIGAYGGYAWGRSRHEDEGGVFITPRFDVDGAVAGGTLGCQVQTPQGWVFGMEADGGWSNKKGEARDLAPFSTDFFSETKEKWLATLRGRTGYASGPWMVYFTSGIAIAGVEIRVFDVTDPSVSATEERTRSGLTAGGGVEWAFAQNLSLKAEYLYVKFGNRAYFNSAPTCCSARGDVELNNHIVKAGLNWRFPVGAVSARY